MGEPLSRFVPPHLFLMLSLGSITLGGLAVYLVRRSWARARQLGHARISIALETSSDGVWDYEFLRQIGRRSAAQLRQLGYEPAPFDTMPGSWQSILHPDDHDRVLALLDTASWQLHDDVEITYRVRAADDGYHTIIDRGRVMERTAEGRPRLLVGVSADVTERVRADAARTESERRFRAIFNSALQGQILLHPDGTCAEVNATALQMVGAERTAVIGVPLVRGPWFTGLEASQRAVQERFDHADSGTAIRFEVDAHLVDDRVGLLEGSFTALSGDSGDVRQVLFELRDVTERRRTEEALREIGALTTMGRLAARVAHEINNPLAGIQNSFLLLADAVPPDHPHHRFVGAIEREIQRIAAVTRQLYETYRPDQEASTSSSLVLAIQDAVSLLDPVNRQRGVRITTDLQDAPALLPVPDALLRQTVYNLLQNAVEASPLGGTVAVHAWIEADECVITVHDEGVGVAPHLRNRIFDPFNSMRDAKCKTAGMGLGLALVRQSVQAVGGRITLRENSIDAGATFEVRLLMIPLIKSAAV